MTESGVSVLAKGIQFYLYLNPRPHERRENILPLSYLPTLPQYQKKQHVVVNLISNLLVLTQAYMSC